MSVVAPAGFQAAGGTSGIKDNGSPDLALVAVDAGPGGQRHGVPAAAVFTTNRAPAAPVTLSRAHLGATGGRVAAVVLNAGCANAATGAAGYRDAAATAALAAAELGVRTEEVLVCSTGLIGTPLPFPALEKGLPALAATLAGSPEAGRAAAGAILTTDTRPKTVDVDGGGWRIGGMAKGAAMLAPDMATMLAVLTTDARVGPGDLGTALRAAVGASFNEVSIDGCCSTNDTVIVLAGGRSGHTPAPPAFAEALAEACADLADQMAADAEGGTKVARITVTGAASDEEAARAARQVAESQLVQCSLHGADPYWGRVVSELGAAGVAFEVDRVAVAYGGVTVCREGVAVDHDREAVARHLAGERVEVAASLGLGTGAATVVTTDLSPAYIAENMRTS